MDADVKNIDISTVKLEYTIPAIKSGKVKVDDYIKDGIPDIAVKFDKKELSAYLGGVTAPAVELTVSGQLYDGTVFEGSDIIVITKKK